MQKWQRGEDKRLDNSVVNLVYRGVVVVVLSQLAPFFQCVCVRENNQLEIA